MMILAPQKKKLASLIISKMSDKPDFVQKLGEKSKEPKMEYESEEMGVESDSSYACESCASDMIDAIKENSPKKFSAALKDFLALVEDDMGEQEEEMEDYESES
jgi:hypothetical protein